MNTPLICNIFEYEMGKYVHVFLIVDNFHNGRFFGRNGGVHNSHTGITVCVNGFLSPSTGDEGRE